MSTPPPQLFTTLRGVIEEGCPVAGAAPLHPPSYTSSAILPALATLQENLRAPDGIPWLNGHCEDVAITLGVLLADCVEPIGAEGRFLWVAGVDEACSVVEVLDALLIALQKDEKRQRECLLAMCTVLSNTHQTDAECLFRHASWQLSGAPKEKALRISCGISAFRRTCQLMTTTKTKKIVLDPQRRLADSTDDINLLKGYVQLCGSLACLRLVTFKEISYLASFYKEAGEVHRGLVVAILCRFLAELGAPDAMRLPLVDPAVFTAVLNVLRYEHEVYRKAAGDTSLEGASLASGGAVVVSPRYTLLLRIFCESAKRPAFADMAADMVVQNNGLVLSIIATHFETHSAFCVKVLANLAAGSAAWQGGGVFHRIFSVGASEWVVRKIVVFLQNEVARVRDVVVEGRADEVLLEETLHIVAELLRVALDWVSAVTKAGREGENEEAEEHHHLAPPFLPGLLEAVFGFDPHLFTPKGTPPPEIDSDAEPQIPPFPALCTALLQQSLRVLGSTEVVDFVESLNGLSVCAVVAARAMTVFVHISGRKVGEDWGVPQHIQPSAFDAAFAFTQLCLCFQTALDGYQEAEMLLQRKPAKKIRGIIDVPAFINDNVNSVSKLEFLRDRRLEPGIAEMADSLVVLIDKGLGAVDFRRVLQVEWGGLFHTLLTVVFGGRKVIAKRSVSAVPTVHTPSPLVDNQKAGLLCLLAKLRTLITPQTATELIFRIPAGSTAQIMGTVHFLLSLDNTEANCCAGCLVLSEALTKLPYPARTEVLPNVIRAVMESLHVPHTQKYLLGVLISLASASVPSEANGVDSSVYTMVSMYYLACSVENVPYVSVTLHHAMVDAPWGFLAAALLADMTQSCPGVCRDIAERPLEPPCILSVRRSGQADQYSFTTSVNLVIYLLCLTPTIESFEEGWGYGSISSVGGVARGRQVVHHCARLLTHMLRYCQEEVRAGIAGSVVLGARVALERRRGSAIAAVLALGEEMAGGSGGGGVDVNRRAKLFEAEERLVGRFEREHAVGGESRGEGKRRALRARWFQTRAIYETYDIAAATPDSCAFCGSSRPREAEANFTPCTKCRAVHYCSKDCRSYHASSLTRKAHGPTHCRQLGALHSSTLYRRRHQFVELFLFVPLVVFILWNIFWV